MTGVLFFGSLVCMGCKEKCAGFGVCAVAISLLQVFICSIMALVWSSKETTMLEEKRMFSTSLGDRINDCSDQYMNLNTSEIDLTLSEALGHTEKIVAFSAIPLTCSVVSCCAIATAIIAGAK